MSWKIQEFVNILYAYINKRGHWHVISEVNIVGERNMDSIR